MRDTILIALGVLLSMTFDFAFPKTFDEKKWEQIQTRREARRVTEQRYQACMTTCSEKCK